MATVPKTTLPDWSIRLLSEFDAADGRVRNLTVGLDAEQLNWRPRQNVWGIGQCLHHLLRVNEVYLPSIAASLENQQRRTVQDIDPGWIGGWFLHNYIEASPSSKKARAPSKVVPVARVEPGIVDALLRSNEKARELVRRASAYDVNRIRFKNPFIPLVRFTVGTGLEIVCKHEVRHLLQAERVKQTGEFPKDVSPK